MSFEVRRLDTQSASFEAELQRLLAWGDDVDAGVVEMVNQIIGEVRAAGDAALLELTSRLDGFAATTTEALCITAEEMAAAFAGLPPADREALTFAAERIRVYHTHQLAAQGQEGFEFSDSLGNRLGQRITPIERIGVYVPGGQAAYPSTVLMTVIPARVAGVSQVLMTVPTPGGVRSPLVLAAAHIAGVDQAFAVGGAQAIAAMAYGTALIPRVDKIVGPGGAYVAAAKRQVFGAVGIDVIAGPSEVLIVADGTAPPEWMALDLFSQAEHDAAAQALLVCPDEQYLDAVAAAMGRLISQLGRADIIRQSMSGRGALIRAADMDDCLQLANRVAPEHLELAVADPDRWLGQVQNAGAVFLGAHSPEVIGDYSAGPSHVLPTFGTARFSSPLGVYDFVKRSSVIGLSVAGSQGLAQVSGLLAQGEGLDAHAAAARVRVAGFDQVDGFDQIDGFDHKV